MKRILFYAFLHFIVISSALHSQWQTQYNGTSKFIISPYFVDANTGFAFGDSALVLKTTNGGTNWTTVNIGTPNSYAVMRGCMVDANRIYLPLTNNIWVGNGDGKILYSSDGGANWTTQLSTPRGIQMIVFTDPNNGYACGNCNGTFGALFRTTNAGANWNLFNVGVYNDLMFIYFYNASTGYLSSMKTDTICKTVDAGASWTRYKANAGYDVISGLFFVDPNTGYALSDHSRFLKTTNGGINWTVNASLDSLTGFSLAETSSSTFYMVSSNGTSYCIRKTTNAGANWYVQLSGNDKDLSSVWFANQSTGWITGMGIILNTNNGGGPIGIKKISNEVPFKYSLEQNYPNPFNPSTYINFDIVLKGNVKITIFDALGREVKTIINQELQTGKYKIEWSAANYPSGAYFYRLETEGFTETKKMVLLR
jgi:photosystem II stability/assembly factor-like uncharacterized protein